MRNSLLRLVSALWLLLWADCGCALAQPADTQALPVEPGYELGVSACYAGVVGRWLVVAGGCNFPEPGRKRYYSGIYTIPLDSIPKPQTGDTAVVIPLSARTLAASRHPLAGIGLEAALAYGASVSMGDSLVFLGGRNADSSVTMAVSLHLDDCGRPLLRRLPALPVPMDNFTAAADGRRIYVFGGNQSGRPSRALWCYDPASPKPWRHLADAPGAPRVQPVCVAYNNKVYIWGGFHACGDSSTVATDGLLYDADAHGWTALPAPVDSLGHPMTLTGGSAILVPSSPSAEEGNDARPFSLSFGEDGGEALTTPSVIFLGGVNRAIFLDAISGRHALVDEAHYQLQPVAWYRFSPYVQRYSLDRRAWLTPVPIVPATARAGAAIATDGRYVYVIGGEVKPTVRTPSVVCLSLLQRR